MNELTSNDIESKIYFIRGFKVMLDSDLAELYRVPTKVLNQAVKRNLERFPDDFMFKPNSNELTELRSQIVTAEDLSDWKFNQYFPNLFTANGVAMLSGVINSPRAIQVNIAIMRIFSKIRNSLLLESEIRSEIKYLKDETGKLFEIVFDRMDSIEETLEPRLSPKRRRIGLKIKKLDTYTF